MGCSHSCSSTKVKKLSEISSSDFTCSLQENSRVHKVLIIQAFWSRGRFVIEYVGEMLTQDQAQKYGQIYDGIKRRSVDLSPLSVVLLALVCYWPIHSAPHAFHVMGTKQVYWISYLYDLDYPESKRTPDFTLDGFHASNVGRFINHR